MDSQATSVSNVSINIVNIKHAGAVETQSQVCNSVGGIAKGERDDSVLSDLETDDESDIDESESDDDLDVAANMDDSDDDIDFTDGDSSESEFDDSDDDIPIHFSIVYKKDGVTKKMRLW
jgi:hypothetical protein